MKKNKKAVSIVIVLLAFSLLLCSCDTQKNIQSSPTQDAQAETIGLAQTNPNINVAPATIKPTPRATNISITSNIVVTPIPTYNTDTIIEMESFLPPQDKTLRYFGYAEYGHIGELSFAHEDAGERAFIFNGKYQDGIGTEDKFSVKYYFNYQRGTITEQSGMNERNNKKELNSKLHNLVVLMFPIIEGDSWWHNIYLDGTQLRVYADVMEYDGKIVKMRYVVPNAKGYYDNLYIEERTYEKGYGMTSFANLIKGDIDISEEDSKDKDKVKDALIQHMFGYQLAKSEIDD